MIHMVEFASVQTVERLAEYPIKVGHVVFDASKVCPFTVNNSPFGRSRTLG